MLGRLLLPLAAATGVAAGLYVAVPDGGEEEVLQDLPTATAEATATQAPPVKGQLWRWVNVTVVVPEGSPVTIGRGTIPSGVKGEGGPGLGPVIDHGGEPEAASYVVIDAVTGEILQDRVAPEDREAIDEVLKTLAVSPFDTAEKGWPYSVTIPADAERRAEFGMSYVVPDPASGVMVSTGIADGFRDDGGSGGPFLEISNGRSTAFVLRDEETNTLSREPVTVSSLDESPFERFISAVKACGSDAKC